jgi:hypothetical protein
MIPCGSGCAALVVHLSACVAIRAQSPVKVLSSPHQLPHIADGVISGKPPMLRVIFAVIVVALVALPAILISLNGRLRLPLRLFLAAAAFVAPLLLIWAIHLVPAFNGEAPQNANFWRGVGVLLSASMLIVPWLIHAAIKRQTD